MIYLGADPSTSSFGIGIFDDEKLIHYEAIAPKINKKTPYIGKTEDWEVRCYLISKRLIEIFKEYDIEEVYCEDIPLKDGKPTIKKLGVIRGCLLSACAMYNTTINPDGVCDWRQNAGFFDGTTSGLKRDAMKRKAVEEVNRLFGIDVCDDIAEAILIAYRSRYPVPKIEKKTLNRKK